MLQIIPIIAIRPGPVAAPTSSGDPDPPMLDIASDVGGRQTRQFIQRLLREQRGEETVAA